MSPLSRRTFLEVAGVSAVGSTAWSDFARSQDKQVKEKNRPVIGFIGCGGRSKSLLSEFQPWTEIRWSCDPDASRLRAFSDKSGSKRITSDMREMLDDKELKAVVIATPDHWHAPAAILACEAGKHVYVEKPCSHNLREGRMLVDAARRNRVVVQHGTQSRTNRMIANAIQMIREGMIGDVLVAKAWNVQRRKNIGKAQPSPVPDGIDYDTWVGPAEFMPYQENRFHYQWHWWHNFGTGDIGNDGAHELDIARWGLGVEGLPTTAFALGGKYYFDDQQEFPDCASCAFEWPGNGQVGGRRQLLFEMRIWSTNYPHNCDTGVEFYGTQGMLFVSKRGKLILWNEENQIVEKTAPKQPVTLADSHALDFLSAIEQGRQPNADIEIGHQSVALIHLANIAVRTGRSLKIDPVSESILDDPEASQLLGRRYRQSGHWSIPTNSISS